MGNTETKTSSQPMNEIHSYVQIEAELTIPIAPFANIRPKVMISAPSDLKDKELVQWLCTEYGNFVSLKGDGSEKKR